MRPQLIQLYSTDGLNAAFAESGERLVVLFKHSVTCSLSSAAHDEFRSFLRAAPADVMYCMLTVQASREVSNEVESRLGVRHESPQVILMRDGEAVWHASHTRITSLKLAEVVARHVSAPEMQEMQEMQEIQSFA